ncbi:MAG: hypothetical protein ABIL09_26855 [Gemmatimonadota bacterium]
MNAYDEYLEKEEPEEQKGAALIIEIGAGEPGAPDAGQQVLTALGRFLVDAFPDVEPNEWPEAVCSALEMPQGELSGEQRKKLPGSDFALPGRRYPIHDEAHARNALARVAQHGSPEEQAKVRAAVRRKFPKIDQDG